MMITPPPTGSLSILNQSASRGRLRFRCGGFPVWDTWIEAGSRISAPPLDSGNLVASATLVDPVTKVTYTVPARVSGKSVRLVAKMTFTAGAASFNVEQEPSNRAGYIALLNLTAAELRFSFDFLDSPFNLNTAVAAQSEQILDLTHLDVSAIVDCVTSAVVPIKSWSSDGVIGVDELHGQKFPHLKLSAREKNGL